MRIGELAKQTGLSTSAIRFYEASGLLPPGARGHNGYRDYGPDALKRLQHIQLARRLGFTLDSLRGLFAQQHDAFPRAQLLASLEQRRAEIARLRSELDAQDADLERLERACAVSWARGECPDHDVFAATPPRAKHAA